MAKKEKLTSKERMLLGLTPVETAGGKLFLASQSQQNPIRLSKEFFLTNVVKKKDLRGNPVFSFTIMKGKGPRDKNAEFYGERIIYAKNRNQVKANAILELKRIGEL